MANIDCSPKCPKGLAKNRTSLKSELIEIAYHLKNEKCFVENEKENIERLYNSVNEKSKKAHSLNWSLHQQRCLLNDLIGGCSMVTPQVCCNRFNSLTDTNFIDSSKILAQYEPRVGKFLKSFRENPKLVALCLSRLESLEQCCMEHLVRVVMLQLYDGLVTHEDEILARKLLENLLVLQIEKHQIDLAKHFLKLKTPFTTAYHLFIECLPSSKTFFTAAFHGPTISLLSEDEWYYDIDLNSAIARLSPTEISKRFGNITSDDYDFKVKVYHGRILEKLVTFVKMFVDNLKCCCSMFPKSLVRIMKSAYRILSKSIVSKNNLLTFTNVNTSNKNNEVSNNDHDIFSLPPNTDNNAVKLKNINNDDVKKALLDVMLSSFICPAICDPQFRGVVFETPVSEVSRHNLMQIAQIIYTLALSTINDVDIRTKDLYDKFDKGCLSFLLEMITGFEDDDGEEDDDDGGSVHKVDDDSPHRSSIMMAPSDLVDLVELVHTTASTPMQSNDYTQHQLQQLITDTRLSPLSTIKTCCKQFLDCCQDNNVGDNVKTLTSSLPVTSSSTSSSSSLQTSSTSSSSTGKKRKNVDTQTSKVTLSISLPVPPNQSNSDYNNNNNNNNNNSSNNASNQPQQRHNHHHNRRNSNRDVLVISFWMDGECPGRLSENKVLEEAFKQGRTPLHKPSIDDDDDDTGQQQQQHHHHHHPHDESINSSNVAVSEKRTRFSLSHDNDSAEPNNNNEAASEEAVSSHSTDNDDNNSNDNLSDMAFSANLSGHNTPSLVSGRDTPVSLISGGPGLGGGGADDDDGDGGRGMGNMANNLNVGSGDNLANNVNNPGGNVIVAVSHNPGASGDGIGANVVGVSMGGVGRGGVGIVVMTTRRRRDDVTDKFGKFDIKQDLEYEAKSTVSDTWSTDVLASDSEPPPEQNQLDRLEEVVEERGVVRGFPSGGSGILGVEISETASDAWSTDVLASDTSERQADRLLELDQDDVCSLSGRSNFSTSSLLRLQQQQQDVFHENVSSSTVSGMTFSTAMTMTSTVDNMRNRTSVFADEFTLKGGFKRRECAIYPTLVPRSTNDVNNANDDCDHKANNNNTNKDDSSFDNSFEQEVFINPNNNNNINNDNINIGFNDQQQNQSNFDNLYSFFNTPNLTMQNNNNINNNSSSMNITATSSSNDAFIMFDPLTSFTKNETRSCEQTKISSSSADNLTTLLNTGVTGKDINNNDNNNINSNNSNNRVNNLACAPQTLLSSRPSSSMTHLPNYFRPTESTFIATSLNNSNTSLNCSLILSKVEDEKKKKSGIFGQFKEKLIKINSSGKRKTMGRGDHTDDTTSHNTPPSSVLIDFNQEGTTPTTSSITTTNNLHVLSTSNDYDTILEKYRKSPQQPQIMLTQTSTATFVINKHNVINNNEDIRPTTHQQQQTSLLSLPTTSSSSSPSPLLAQSTQWDDSKLTQKNGGDGDSKSRDGVNGGGNKGVGGDGGYKVGGGGVADNLVEAKMKLRLVLSKVDCCQFQLSTRTANKMVPINNNINNHANDNNHNNINNNNSNDSNVDNELIVLLKYLLAEALVVDDRILATQLQATIKCLSTFQQSDLKKILKSMRADYKSRSCYIAYLTRCKRSLLACNHSYEKLLARITKDQQMLNKYMISVMTRLFLEKRNRSLVKFIGEFQNLVVFDEKCDLLEKFVTANHDTMRMDVAWKAATEQQLEEARLCMERMIMSHIYIYAMYPNGDGDTSRDRLLEEHMQRLSMVITADHKDLRIPALYQNECPWLAAQKELIMINAFKTPEDKLECVVRCCSTIMTLLSMSKRGENPAADDLLPVLLYVVIKSGVPNLLSTIQYIDSYCYNKNNSAGGYPGDGGCCYRGGANKGEVLYCWTQFVAAVNYIKSMDYRE